MEMKNVLQCEHYWYLVCKTSKLNLYEHCPKGMPGHDLGKTGFNLNYANTVINVRPMSSARWTKEEKAEYCKLLSVYGKDFQCIAEHLPNKNYNMCANFWMNYRYSICLKDLCPEGSEKYQFSTAKMMVLKGKKIEEITGKTVTLTT
jgi:hypothetical protein